jgi:hypothetical protein
VLRVCDRFHVLPSEVLEQDVTLFRMLAVEARGRREVL